MNKLIIILMLLVSGCTSLKPDPISDPIRLINSNVYPNLPDMTYPLSLNLTGPRWDVPRDTFKDLVVKSLTVCKKVLDEDRDDKFWSTCGEYPPTVNSNIYQGYNLDEFNHFLENQLKISLKLKEYKDRIDLINTQRQEWRRLNEENK